MPSYRLRFGFAACCVVCAAGTPLRAEEPKAAAALSVARFDPLHREMEGWTVWVDPALVEGQYRESGELALGMLANHLQRISLLVPAEPLARLRRAEIWIEREHPTLHAMQYHPAEQWLIDHDCDPRLAKKVHIPQARQLLERGQLIKHPAVVLHELAHAYHDQVLGFDDAEIRRLHEAAQSSGKYESVLLYTGEHVRHYGLTTPMEYFAEGTEAYFYRNDFYPFVRAELQEHDPALHELLERVWGQVR